jgi:hypothetical protein
MGASGKKFGKDLSFALDSSCGGTLVVGLGAWIMKVDGLPGEREMADVTCGGGAVAHQFLLGLQNATISLSCLFDQTTDSAYDTLSGYMDDTGSRTFHYYPASSSSGCPDITGECRIKDVILPAAPLEPLTFTATLVLDSTMVVTVCG